MKHKEFETLLEENTLDDKQFLEYLKKNPIKNLEFMIENENVVLEKGNFTVLETSVLEYIEELCSYDGRTFENEREEKIAKELKKVIYYSFFYFKEGVSYMDLVQEGIVGLIKGIDFQSEFLDAWIIREIFLKVKAEIRDLKFEFKNFLKAKREEIEQQHEEEEHSDNFYCGCSTKHHEKDLKKEFLKEEIEKEKIDRNEVLKKLLQSNLAIDDMEKIIEDRLDYQKMKYRLHPIEIEVLNYYFGLLVDKRYSIFEIEEQFTLEKNYAQNIFENALYKLSTIKGKVEL